MKTREELQRAVNLVHFAHIEENLVRAGIIIPPDPRWIAPNKETCDNIMLEGVCCGIFPQTDEDTIKEIISELYNHDDDEVVDDEVVQHFVHYNKINNISVK